ncbi:MAG: hypothetical protein ACP5U0_08470, partial [Caldisphaera sp.]
MDRKKTFLFLIPNSLNDFHERAPWVKVPEAFNDLGFKSILICTKYKSNIKPATQITELAHSKESAKITVPLLSFRYLLKEKPDIIMTPLGRHLVTFIPLIFIYKTFLRKSKNHAKFILKSDLNLNSFTNNIIIKLFIYILLIASSYTFDLVTFESTCSVEKAKKLK